MAGFIDFVKELAEAEKKYIQDAASVTSTAMDAAGLNSFTDNPIHNFVFPRGLSGTLEAQINPIEADRIQIERMNQLGNVAHLMPPPMGAPFQAWNVGRQVLTGGDEQPKRTSKNKRAEKPTSKGQTDNTESMTSQQVQARQEVRSRPDNSGGNRVTPQQTARRTDRAMEQYPKAMARARNMGSPNTENLTGAMLSGQIDPQLALARGWITEQKFELMQRMLNRLGRTQPQQTAQRSAIGPTGTTPAQASPGQRQQMQPQTTGTRVTGNDQDFTPRSQQTRQPTSNVPPTELHQQSIQRHMQNLQQQGQITPGTTSDQVTLPQWQLSVDQLAPEQAAQGGAGFQIGGNQLPSDAGITLSIPEQQALQQDASQGVATVLTHLGVPMTDPVAGWMTDQNNAQALRSQHALLLAEPGQMVADGSNFPDFLYDRYMSIHNGDHSREKQIYASHIQEILSNPNAPLAQAIDGAESPADAYWAWIMQPMLSLSPTTPAYVFSNAKNQLDRADQEWRASGAQMSFLQYLASNMGRYSMSGGR